MLTKLYFFLFCVFISTVSYAQSDFPCSQAFMLIKTAEAYHYEPKMVNDSFSNIVYTNFLHIIDPDGYFFTQNDIDQIDVYKDRLDDEILNTNCLFIDKVTEIYSKELLFVDSMVNTFYDNVFDFTIDDKYYLKEDNPYLSKSELIEKWNKWLKFQILHTSFFAKDTLDGNSLISIDSLSKIQPIVITNQICRLKTKMNYAGGIRKYIGDCFLQAISYSFDPHTSYFTSFDKEMFETDLSKITFSFGIEFGRNNAGEVEIYYITPGGPAWISNSFDIGDILLDVKDSNDQTKYFSCLAIEDVMQYLYSDSIKVLSFHIRKKNGKENYVFLKKENINVDNNIIRSFILKGKNNKKIGYIYLPSFYSQRDDFENITNECSKDMIKEVINLSIDEIEGLIIDIRNNGGGDMDEAARLAGIFINVGALGIFKNRNQEPIILRDLYKGIVYDDPIVILVNNFSASASEFFSASMQDYNRAVIVGQNTFGKFTFQNILPVDAYKYSYKNPDKRTISPDGYVKLTTGKFFRVTGKSHQKEGVRPDIMLPAIYDDIEVGEKYFETSLDSSSINMKTYYFPLDTLPINKLKFNSDQRIANDRVFNRIKKISRIIAKQKNETTIPLRYDLFVKFYSNNPFIEYNDETQIENMYSVINPDASKGKINNTFDKNMKVNIMKSIESDIYVNEAFHVINDLIELNKK